MCDDAIASFDNHRWAQGLFLRERAISALPSELEPDKINESRSRYETWKSGFASENEFINYLSSLSLSKESFLLLAGESDRSLTVRVRSRSDLRDLLDQLSASSTGKTIHLEGVGPLSDSTVKQFPLCVLATEVIDRVCSDLRRYLGAKRSLVDRVLHLDIDELHTLLLPHLLARVSSIILRTLVLEVNISRIQGKLKGSTPGERFDFFVRQLNDDRNFARRILNEYPALVRQINTVAELWRDFCLQFVGHLLADWEDIVEVLLGRASPGPLVRLKLDAGDCHQGGKSVVLAKFESGLRLVYKPRSMAVDSHFQELCSWINAKRGEVLFRPIKVIARPGHGWMEFVESSPCGDEVQLERFYYRQGACLAISYLLDATDFHGGNVIASGEHPVLIDLETLFHPTFVPDDGTAHAEFYQLSVMRSGLLPRRKLQTFDDLGLDSSGIGASAGELLEATSLLLDKPWTDEMCLIKKRVVSRPQKNQPQKNGRVSLMPHTDALVEGFRSVYQLITRERDYLLSKTGPLNAFAHDLIRVVFRPTDQYGAVLADSYHPNLLRNALDREGFLHTLWRDVRFYPWLAKVAPSELKDLLSGDIPYFTGRPESRDLWNSNGERIEDFLHEPPLERVLRRLANFSDKDMARQIWYIRASIASTSDSLIAPEEARLPLLSISSALQSTREEIIDAADQIGARIVDLCHESDQRLSWIGMTLVAPDRFALLPIQSDLYSGLSGIALFLGYLGYLTNRDSYKNIALKTLRSARAGIHELIGRSDNLGAFTGVGGYLYAVDKLANILEVESYTDEIPRITEELAKSVPDDYHCDIIAGSAGLLAVMLGLYSQTGLSLYLTAVDRCARNLVNRAMTQDAGVSWQSKPGSPPMSGFSHGAAGISWALFRASLALSSREYERTAWQGVNFERSLLDLEKQNWIRHLGCTNTDVSPFQCGWCHGAPGIGLAKLDLLSTIHDDQTSKEISMAIDTTLKLKSAGSHSLCHGHLGNLDFIMTAARYFNDVTLQSEVRRRLKCILDETAHLGWICGLPARLEMPSLMTGLAGVGYGLLRIIEPDTVPCVLLLSNPT